MLKKFRNIICFLTVAATGMLFRQVLAQEIELNDGGIVFLESGSVSSRISSTTKEPASTASIYIGKEEASAVSLTGDLSEFYGSILFANGAVLYFNPTDKTTYARVIVGGTDTTTFVKQGGEISIDGYEGDYSFILQTFGILDLSGSENKGDLILAKGLFIEKFDKENAGQIWFRVGASSYKLICTTGKITTDDPDHGQIDISHHIRFDMAGATGINGTSSSFVFAHTAEEPFFSGTPNVVNANGWSKFSVTKKESDEGWDLVFTAWYKTSSSISVETMADGSGTVLPSQKILLGQSIDVFAIGRDENGDFIENIAATSWSLTRVMGEVDSNDLVVAQDRKSATLVGHKLCCLIISADSSGLTSVKSGTISVISRPAAKLEFLLASCQQNGEPFVGDNTITVKDSQGNIDTTFDASITPVTVSCSPGNGSITGLGTGNNSILNQKDDFTDGVANLTDRMVFSGTPGVYIFTASIADTITGSYNSLIVSGAPTGNETQSLCSPSLVGDLDVSGNDITWYTLPNGGTPISPSALLQNGATYFASQTINGCESTSRLQVTVVLETPPTAAFASNDTTICAFDSTRIKVGFEGQAPFSFIYMEGETSHEISDIEQKEYVFIASPPPNNSTIFKISEVTDRFGCTNSVADSLTINVLPDLTTTVSGEPADLCYGSEDAVISATPKANLIYPVGYQWQSSPDNINWTDIAGAQSLTYLPGKMVETTYFRIQSHTGYSCASTSNAIKINVFDSIAQPTIMPDQTICYGSIPILLIGTPPHGGSGIYIYQWQEKTTENWIVTGENSLTYQPSTLYEKTLYRLKATDKSEQECGTVYSNELTINVNQILPGTIGYDQSIETGKTPQPIVSLSEASGQGSITYYWEMSEDSGQTWMYILGESGNGYSPGALLNSTWYKRIADASYDSLVCSASTDPVKIILWPVSVEYLEENEDLIVYAMKNIGIYVKGKVKQGTIANLYDVQGRLMLEKILNEGSLNFIPTPNINEGTYIVCVISKKRYSTYKVVFKKEHTWYLR